MPLRSRTCEREATLQQHFQQLSRELRPVSPALSNEAPDRFNQQTCPSKVLLNNGRIALKDTILTFILDEKIAGSNKHNHHRGLVQRNSAI